MKVEAEAPQCLIGPTTDVQKSAGFLASSLRDGISPVVKAISADNVNKAVKTLALARNYLADEDADFYVQVDFPEYAESNMTANAQLHVFPKAKRTNLSRVNAHLSVSSSSRPAAVAGAIAGSLREAALGRICVTAAGAQAVLMTMKAIYLARHYLQEEGNDASVLPEFDHSEDGKISLINFFVLSHASGATL